MANPLICWKNLLEGSTYNITLGTEIAGTPLSNAWNDDTLRGAIVEADANGVFSVTITVNSQLPFGTDPWGYTPWGNHVINALVIGAHRHDSAGFRTTGLTWDFAGVNVVDGYPQNSSIVFPLLDTPITTSSITLTITGANANQGISIPALFAGNAIDMGGIEYGFDPYDEQSNTTIAKTESGRDYLSLRYLKMRQKPSWKLVHKDLWSFVDMFREANLEIRKPFFFCWNPDVAHETYFVRHASNRAPFPINTALYRSFKLDLEEVL